ncbi:MAG: SRPBCC domain-containing protein [Phycisphaerales bacterium]|nr:MAG: SRPBCC domain-containing protein [Phycisphaerales bacterium]
MSTGVLGMARTGLILWTLGVGLNRVPAGLAGESGAENTEPRILRKEVTVTASPQEVWLAWTTTDGAKSFFAPEAHIELRVGGPYELYFNPSAPEGQRGSEGCRVLSFLPGEMLSFSWNAPLKFPEIRKERTCVVLRFEHLGDGRVRVKVYHHGWGEGAQWDQVYAYFDRAWDLVLGRFGQRFSPAATEAGTPKERLQFAYYLRPARETFVQDATEEENRIVGEHFQYLTGLLNERCVVMAGRTLEDYPVGIVVFEADDTEAAEKIMRDDPAVAAGIFKGEVHPFRVALIRE